MGIPLAELTIDAVMVRELLFQQHSDLAELSLLAVSSGWDNAIFRLGEHLAVRLPRRELAAALVLNEQRWLPRLAAQLPLKVPVPLRVGVPQEWYPWAWSIVPWIDGETADVAPPDDDQADVLGRFFEALHRPAPADAPHNPYRGVPLAQREVSFEERAAKLTGRCDAIDTRVIAIWNEALAAQESTASTWIHGDMHPRNVLCARGRIEGIIDWGDIAQGDAASDLAGIWMPRWRAIPGWSPWRSALSSGSSKVRDEPRADGFLHLIRPHAKKLKQGGTEGSADGDICGVAAARNQNPADAALIIARIEGVPGTADVGFQPAREIHGRIGNRHANIAEVSAAIARRDVQTAQQRDCQMRKIAAYALALAERFPRRLG